GCVPGLETPAGATVVDLGDATLLPGFIESHMHLPVEATDDFVYGFFDGLRRTVAENALRAGGFSRRLLEAGFTTVRNVGAYDDEGGGLRNAITRGEGPRPRRLVSALAIGATGGPCDPAGGAPY